MDAELLAERVREGCGLKQAIAEQGLPVKATLIALRDGTHRDLLKSAKREAIQIRELAKLK